MARIPQKVDKDEQIERIIPIPGWAYNFMIDRAKEERRDVKAQIAFVLENAIKEMQAQYAKQ